MYVVDEALTFIFIVVRLRVRQLEKNGVKNGLTVLLLRLKMAVSVHHLWARPGPVVHFMTTPILVTYTLMKTAFL